MHFDRPPSSLFFNVRIIFCRTLLVQTFILTGSGSMYFLLFEIKMLVNALKSDYYNRYLSQNLGFNFYLGKSHCTDLIINQDVARKLHSASFLLHIGSRPPLGFPGFLAFSWQRTFHPSCRLCPPADLSSTIRGASCLNRLLISGKDFCPVGFPSCKEERSASFLDEVQSCFFCNQESNLK